MNAQDPVQLAVSQEGLERRLQACSADAPVRLAVIANPRARRLQRSGWRAALAGLVGATQYAETRDLASLHRAIAHQVAENGANVLAIAGGDGSLHHAVNALWQLAQETEDKTGVAPPWPRVLILNGGTLNIVGRSVAIHGPPEQTLRQFLGRCGGGPLSRVAVRPVPMLQVRWQGEASRLGFVFGSALAYHALELYSRFGAGYLGLSRFLVEFSRGALFGSKLWREEAWKLGPYADLTVDGRHWHEYGGVAAATADLTLAIGAVRAIRRPLGAPGFAVRVVEETVPRKLVGLLPSLMSERGGAGVVDLPVAHHMRLSGPYTLDGECFHEPAPHVPLLVERFATALPVVLPGEA